MIQNTKIARDLGYLHIDDENIIDAYDSAGLPADKVVVMCTGSQGEPLSALARIANGDHRTIDIESGDTVVISASPIPGNEKAVSRVINRLSKAGASVFHKGTSDVHVSGHAAAEELKLMLNIVQPEFFMPIHGETRHLAAHARLAQSVGVPADCVFVLDNGDCLELDAEEVRVGERVESGVVYVDGLSVGDVGTVVLRDRQHMSQDGILTVVIVIDALTGKRVGDPEIVMRGIVFAEDQEVLEEARARIVKALDRTGKEGVTDSSVVQKRVRESLSQFLWERIRRRPMIIPVVMEV
jgi:ribonuclease J